MYLIEEDGLSFELVLVALGSSNWYKAYGDSVIVKELPTEGVAVDCPQLGQDQASSSFVKRASVQPSHLSNLKKNIIIARRGQKDQKERHN